MTFPLPPQQDPPVSTESGQEVPPALYLPLSRKSTAEQQLVEIRKLKDGRLALLAYTALDRLLALTGENQPWALFRTEELQQIKQQQSFEVVIFDLEIPVEYRRDGAIA